jgi:hypothetical protein
MSSDPQIEEIFKSLETLSPITQDRIMKQFIERHKEANKAISKEVSKEALDPPTYAEVVSGARIPRSITPDSTKATSKHILNSPETPYHGGSRKVLRNYNLKLILFRYLELRGKRNLILSILYLMKKME